MVELLDLALGVVISAHRGGLALCDVILVVVLAVDLVLLAFGALAVLVAEEDKLRPQLL